MATWTLLLITLLIAVLLGCIIGVAVGKHQVKKASGNYKPLLSTREHIVYTICVIAGVGLILTGLLYTPGIASPQEGDPTAGMGMEPGMEDGMEDDGLIMVEPDGDSVETDGSADGGENLEDGETPLEEASDDSAADEAVDDAADAAEATDSAAAVPAPFASSPRVSAGGESVEVFIAR